MKRKNWMTILWIMVMCSLFCACGNKAQDDNSDDSMQVVDGKMFITEDMQQELEEYFGADDSSDRASKAELRILKNAKSYAISVNAGYDLTSCEVISYEKVDDYNYEAVVKVYGTDDVGEDLEIEFTATYYFEENAEKEEGYQLVEIDTELSESIFNLRWSSTEE